MPSPALYKSVMKKMKPMVKVGVHVDTPPSSMPGEKKHDWRKEEMDRCMAEIAALEKELADFSPKKAADQVKKSIEIKLKLKKLRVEEHKLNLDGDAIGY
jgi:ribosome-binding ATPase YchF (GTP1/OBG family)